ncbi:MAG TPA: InlB B-repeat-containing protein [Patescibacteria group bacterium]|nr:InlB B-repeat-containing protein [Patescibacteria group bacterium]
MFNKKKFLSSSLIILAVFLVSFFIQTNSAKASVCDRSVGNTVCRINHSVSGMSVVAYSDDGTNYQIYSVSNISDSSTQDTFIPLKTATEWQEFKLYHPSHIRIMIPTIPSYTLTYSSTTGGTVEGPNPQTVSEGSDGDTVSAFTQTGYAFTGWSDNVSTEFRTDTNVTSDISVTANFELLQDYTLTYDAVTYNGFNYGVGVITGTNPQTVVEGGDGTEVTAEPGVLNSDYVFDCWSDGYAIQTVDGNPASRKDVYVTSDIDVTAYFTLTGASSPPACGGDDSGDDGGGGGGHIIVPVNPKELPTL